MTCDISHLFNVHTAFVSSLVRYLFRCLSFFFFFKQGIDSSFIFSSEWLYIAWMYNSFLSIHQLKDVLVFEVLAIINKTA